MGIAQDGALVGIALGVQELADRITKGIEHAVGAVVLLRLNQRANTDHRQVVVQRQQADGSGQAVGDEETHVGNAMRQIEAVAQGREQVNIAWHRFGDHVGAVYDGKIRVPIRDKAGNILPEDELTRRLYHEYTHVIVRSWAGDKVPWWFNEGLAETFSNPLSEAELGVLREANAQDLLFKLVDIEQGQLKKLDPDALQLAYQQAHATVDFLWSKYGVRGLSAMLENLRLGNSAEESLVLSYRLNYLLLEKEVSQTLGSTVAQR